MILPKKSYSCYVVRAKLDENCACCSKELGSLYKYSRKIKNLFRPTKTPPNTDAEFIDISIYDLVKSIRPEDNLRLLCRNAVIEIIANTRLGSILGICASPSISISLEMPNNKCIQEINPNAKNFIVIFSSQFRQIIACYD
jgi:hypothetical protein